jgi:uncharacterized protein YeaO (DUF488 family)
MSIQLKRVYEDAAKNDGLRILVDRVWPRGVSKQNARLDHWFKELAPSADLRKWFGHDPEKWREFKRRYFKELDSAPDEVAELRETMGKRNATLLFAAKDEAHNNAVALKSYLQEKR